MCRPVCYQSYLMTAHIEGGASAGRQTPAPTPKPAFTCVLHPSGSIDGGEVSVDERLLPVAPPPGPSGLLDRRRRSGSGVKSSVSLNHRETASGTFCEVGNIVGSDWRLLFRTREE